MDIFGCNLDGVLGIVVATCFLFCLDHEIYGADEQNLSMVLMVMQKSTTWST